MHMYVLYSKNISIRKSNLFTIITIAYLTYNSFDIIIIIIVARAAIVSETPERWENRPNSGRATNKVPLNLIIVLLSSSYALLLLLIIIFAVSYLRWNFRSGRTAPYRLCTCLQPSWNIAIFALKQ